MTTYQATVLRYVHDVRTGEFANIGIAMWLPEERVLHFRLNDRVNRLSPFFGHFSTVRYKNLVRHFRSALKRLAEEVAADDLFREVAPTIESVLSRAFVMDDPSLLWSDSIYGITSTPRKRLEYLYAQMVLVQPTKAVVERRSEADVWRTFHRELKARNIDQQVQNKVTIAAGDFSHTFKIGWQNGVAQVLDPISFDMVDPADALEKAAKWHGRLDLLSGAKFKFTAILARPRGRTQSKQLAAAYRILREAPNVRDVVPEEEAADFIEDILADLDHDQPG